MKTSPLDLSTTPSWLERPIAMEELRVFRGILELHGLTLAWLQSLELEAKPFFQSLERGMSPKLAPEFRTLASGNLADALESAHAKEALDRLEHVAWAIQAWSLKKILGKSEADPALRNLLENVSWKRGREAYRAHWSPLGGLVGGLVDVRQVLLKFESTWLAGCSALSGGPEASQSVFLVERALAHQADVELLRCPHFAPAIEAEPVQNDLCSLHAEWMRGFGYEAHASIRLEHRVKPEASSSRCRQRWLIHGN